jgi:hypothetical protein
MSKWPKITFSFISQSFTAIFSRLWYGLCHLQSISYPLWSSWNVQMTQTYFLIIFQSFSIIYYHFQPFVPFVIPFVQFVVHCIPFMISIQCPNDPKLHFQSFANHFQSFTTIFNRFFAICDTVCAVCGPLHTVCDIYSMSKWPNLFCLIICQSFFNHLIPFSTVCAYCDTVCAVCGPLHTVCDLYSMSKWPKLTFQ